jgi:hypothetical protein
MKLSLRDKVNDKIEGKSFEIPTIDGKIIINNGIATYITDCLTKKHLVKILKFLETENETKI